MKFTELSKMPVTETADNKKFIVVSENANGFIQISQRVTFIDKKEEVEKETEIYLQNSIMLKNKSKLKELIDTLQIAYTELSKPRIRY